MVARASSRPLGSRASGARVSEEKPRRSPKRAGSSIRIGSVALLACAMCLVGCGSPRSSRPLPQSEDGERLLGLTASQAADFARGREEFTALREEDAGLGPLFNARSCVECHGIPQVGGTGRAQVTHAGFTAADGSFVPLDGGTLVPTFSIRPGVVQPVIPEGATVARRRVNPLFGAGLVEAIPDETLDAEARGQAPELRGRVNWVIDPVTGTRRAGRFGWKASHATVEGFSAQALRDELGITTPLFPDEVFTGADPAAVARLDSVADPDTSTALPESMSAFVRGLAPLQPPDAEVDVLSGSDAFSRCACDACHVPELLTGRSDSLAFDRVRVPLYSDLLLHRVGNSDGIAEAGAAPDEMRTAPLWGLWSHSSLWHDGRAHDVREAIELHHVQAEQSRLAFDALSAAEQDALLAFVRSR